MGGTPYPGIPTNQLLEDLKLGVRMKKPEWCPDELYEVMTWCWNEVVEQRPTFQRLVDHFDSIISSKCDVRWCYIDFILE